MRGTLKGWLLMVLLSAMIMPGAAQLLIDFEPPTYSSGLLAGQGGWYTPVPSTSSPWLVYTYSSNPLGVGPNPFGSTQMIAAIKDTSGFFPRAQRDFDWSAQSQWLVSYDVYVSFDPSVSADGNNYNNIGSFSLQPSVAGVRFFIDLFQWVTPSSDIEPGNPNDGWRAAWVVSDTGGTSQFVVFFTPPNPFHGLQINTWYRRFVAFNLSDPDPTKRHIVKVGIRNLSTGETYATLVRPTESFPYWYLVNYLADGIPTAFRYFVGGGTGANNGNILAVDNIAFNAFSFGDVDMNGCVDDADLLAVLFDFGSSGAFKPTDVNSDGVVDDADLLTVLFDFGSGC